LPSQRVEFDLLQAFVAVLREIRYRNNGQPFLADGVTQEGIEDNGLHRCALLSGGDLVTIPRNQIAEGELRELPNIWRQCTPLRLDHPSASPTVRHHA
jgi:hypothetical protein